jgi:Xaa-Pro aminopeptidase
MTTKLKSLVLVAALSAFSTSSQAQIPSAEYASRRAALAQKLGNGILVALGNPEPEEDFISFNQNSNFRYLTNFNEPDAALVMVVRNGAISGTPMLFVQPSDPAREVWTGHRLGIPGVRTTLGMEGRDFATLSKVVDSLAASQPSATLFTVGNFNAEGPIITRDDQIVGGFTKSHNQLEVKSSNNEVANLRRIKTPAELDLIRRAVNITVGAQRDAMRLIAPGMNEFEVQALIEYDFRRNGADRPSFSTIVGSGPNSTTLHYNADDRFIEENDVIVMDIGASYRGYAADVTRTVPADGTFSDAQRDIYTAVRASGRRSRRESQCSRTRVE